MKEVFKIELSDIRTLYDQLDEQLSIDTTQIPLAYCQGKRSLGKCKLKRIKAEEGDYYEPVSIHINKRLFEDKYHNELIDTAKHEYAHAANCLINKEKAGKPHGYYWKKICDIIGCSPKATTSFAFDSNNENNEKQNEQISSNQYFYLLVCGSRSFDDYNLLRNKLNYYLQNKKNIVIVSGGAKGADSLAEKYAKERGCEIKIFIANWDKYGKRAGYIRNEKMFKYIAQFPEHGCVAFWDGNSRGTMHDINIAKAMKVPIKIVKYQKMNEGKIK